MFSLLVFFLFLILLDIVAPLHLGIGGVAILDTTLFFPLDVIVAILLNNTPLFPSWHCCCSFQCSSFSFERHCFHSSLTSFLLLILLNTTPPLASPWRCSYSSIMFFLLFFNAIFVPLQKNSYSFWILLLPFLDTTPLACCYFCSSSMSFLLFFDVLHAPCDVDVIVLLFYYCIFLFDFVVLPPFNTIDAPHISKWYPPLHVFVGEGEGANFPSSSCLLSRQTWKWVFFCFFVTFGPCFDYPYFWG